MNSTVLSSSPPNLGALPSDTSCYWNGFDIALSTGGTVSSWKDRVGGFVMSAASQQPKFSSGGLNGNPWVFFDLNDPSNPLLCTTGIFSGSYAGFWAATVLRVPSYLANYETPILCFGTDSPPNVNGVYGNNALCLGWNANVTANPAIEWKVNQNADFGSGTFSAKHRVPLQREMVMVFNYDGVNGYLWVDGVCVFASAQTGNITINGGVGVGSLYTPTGFRNQISMGVSAIAGGKRALSESEIRKVSDYFVDSFLQTSNRVVFMGDSTYEGTASPVNGTIVDVLMPSVLNGYFENCAIGGATMATQAGGVTPYPQMYGSIRRGQVVVLGPGSIDITSLVPVATVEANTAAVIASLQAQGAIVILPTMIDEISSDQTTSNANRATYNSWILAGSSGANYTVDLTGISQISANGAHTNATYFLGDGEHLTAAGIALQAPPFIPVIQRALGAAPLASILSTAGITPVADGTVTPLTSETTKSGIVTALS